MWLVASAFGFSITSPGKAIEQHQIEHVVLDSTLSEMNGLLKALVRGRCLDTAKIDLERSGLIVSCRSLGIQK